MKRLLVVVDMQNDFITGSLGSQQAIAILPYVRREIKARSDEGWEIVYTRDTHEQDYLETQEGRNLPVKHCIHHTYGWELAKNIYTGGRIFNKPAFGSVELGEYVRDGGYAEVELIGLCTDICVISNAMLIKAYAPETAVSVRERACAGVSEESHRTALDAMRACQIGII